ncbi:MAG: penicillin-binding protein activator [Rhizobiales bacterium]|nr:penicillin-binding protein activator [Hyphomicrobiales bacterium]
MSAVAVVAVVLAACSSVDVPTVQEALPPVEGEVLGTGATKVAMLLPLSATGNAAQLAKDMRNAADLALREFPNATIQILIKDDRGTPNGARAATTAALSEGSQLILGPFFSQAVVATGSVAKPAGVPVIAFSTDSTTASKGVYLMSFLPQSDVDRIVTYAASQGRQSIAALLPANAYGTVVEATLQRVAANTNSRILAVEKYNLDRASMQEKATAIAALVQQGTVNTVLLPDGGDATPFLAQILAANGVPPGKVQFLGSGQWNDPRVLAESNLSGGWFPGPNPAGFQAFATRFKAAYGNEPLRNASLAYDAVSLAIGLSGRFGAEGFTDKVLTNPSGFVGVDGAFRFTATGTNQRALAVFQLERGQPVVISPPPTSFSSAGY